MIHPKLPAVAVVATLALLASGQRARAQSASEMEARLEAGALNSRSGAVPLSGFALTPALRYATNRFAVRARGSAWMGEQSWSLGDADVSAEAFAPLARGVRAELRVGADRMFYDQSLSDNQLDAEARLHYMAEKGGVWLGSGVSRPLRVAAASTINVSSGGAWTKLGPTTLRGTVTSFYFTKIVDTTTFERRGYEGSVACASAPAAPIGKDEILPNLTGGGSAGCSYSSRLTDVEGSVHWQHRFIEVTMRGGHRFGPSVDIEPERPRWGSVQVAYWITSQVAAVAGSGREPSQPSRGLPARDYTSLGIMLAYWPIPRQTVLVASPASLVRAFELRPAGIALQRLTARIGGVEKVEIMGDFTDWAPVPLTRRGRDHWELLIPMSPGVHQINLRIDGGKWIAPPGIPSIKDGFNGHVGVLVIRN